MTEEAMKKDRAMKGRLEGKTAIITGASSGIGKATSGVFMREGAKVIGLDSQAPPDELLAQDNFSHVEIDLIDRIKCNEIVDYCIHRFGYIHVLVNNAGMGGAKSIHRTNDEDLDRCLDINLAAPFQLSRAVIVHMRERGGSIINMASVWGMAGVTASAGYSATKAALIGLTRQLATEFGRSGIRVNAVAPGLMVTPLTQEIIKTKPVFRQIMIDGCPLGRPGNPEEVGEACAFLASDAASFITGVILPVDGGWLDAKFLPPARQVGAD